MKITKDEKQLYKFLDIVNRIFGKTANRTYLIGRGDHLYFYTLGYCGVFKSQDDDRHLLDAYDFGNKEYQLKQLPNKEYVLDQCINNELGIQANVLNFIDNRYLGTLWQMELYKEYPCKAAKIAVQTNKWMKDEDLSLLKAFDTYDVFTCGDGLVFSYKNEVCSLYLIFMDSVVAPDNDDVTQLKLEEIETSLIQRQNDVEESAETSAPAENVETGINEPVEDKNAERGSIDENTDYEYDDDPMA
jgi:hypothetical protein